MNKQWLQSIFLLAFYFALIPKTLVCEERASSPSKLAKASEVGSCSAAGPNQSASTGEKLQNLRKKTQDKASHLLGDYGEGAAQVIGGASALYLLWFIPNRCLDKTKQEPLKNKFYLLFDEASKVVCDKSGKIDSQRLRQVDIDLQGYDGTIKLSANGCHIDSRKQSLAFGSYSKVEYGLGTVILTAAFANIYYGCRKLYDTWQKKNHRGQEPYVIHAEDAMKK